MTKREVDRLGDRMKTKVPEPRDPRRDLNLHQRVLVNIIVQILMIISVFNSFRKNINKCDFKYIYLKCICKIEEQSESKASPTSRPEPTTFKHHKFTDKDRAERY